MKIRSKPRLERQLEKVIKTEYPLEKKLEKLLDQMTRTLRKVERFYTNVPKTAQARKAHMQELAIFIVPPAVFTVFWILFLLGMRQLKGF